MITLNNRFLKIMAVGLIVILISSCDTFFLSDISNANLMVIGAAISIEQDPYDQNINKVSVKLFDTKGRQIEDKNIKIRVNNQELLLERKDELYYTKRVRYKGSNIPISDSYYFDIEFSKDSIFELAHIQSIPTIEKGNIKHKKEGDIHLATKIEWEGLKEFDEMWIWKTYKMNDEQVYSGGRYDESTIQKKIKQKGDYTVPLSFYKDSESTITFLYIEFLASKKGFTNPDLLPESTIELTSKELITMKIR